MTLQEAIERERIARIREISAQHQAGALGWDDFVTQAMALLERRAGESVPLHVLDEIPREIVGRLVIDLRERDPNHWVRGLGDGGIAEELAELADRQDDEERIMRHVDHSILTPAQKRRPVRNAIVRELIASADAGADWRTKSAAFDRALAAVKDENVRERTRLLILVMQAWGLPRE